MMARLFCALAVVCLFVGNLSAQTIRFDTNVGTFDMQLNPTGNPFLQGHVDNMLAYVLDGRYDLTIINRAPAGFVLQMGGFQAESLTLGNSIASFNADFPAIAKFDNVVVDTNRNNVVSFSTAGLTNTRSTVTLALSSNNQNIPQVSSGSSSFFISLMDNSRLDVGQAQGGFIPFAEIENMETVNLIMALSTDDLNTVPRNSPNWNATFGDIPILEDNKIVFIERAFVVNTPDAMITSALANADLENFDPSADGGLAAALSTPSVPEPSSLVLAGVMAMLSVLKRRR